MQSRIVGIECARTEAQELQDRFGVASAAQLRIEECAARLGLELVERRLKGAEAQLVVGPGASTLCFPAS